jgi:uncharacterized membrane protein YphA (DoxX/SURF4 family)
MLARHRIGLNLAPLALRLALAAVFIFAGWAKVSYRMDAPPADINVLVKVGSLPPSAAIPPVVEVRPRSQAETPGSAPPAATQEPGPAQAPPPEAPAGAAPQIRLLDMLAVSLYRAANPDPAEGGKRPMALWPRSLGSDSWALYTAWAVTLTELAGGVFVLAGLLTRFWAMGLACVMLGALWLTQIGPALQSGNTMLGVLPRRGMMDPGWQAFWLQLALLASALALVALGAGRLSLDRLIFGGRGDA